LFVAATSPTFAVGLLLPSLSNSHLAKSAAASVAVPADISDFIQKKGALISRFETTHFASHRSRESPSLVPEEFALSNQENCPHNSVTKHDLGAAMLVNRRAMIPSHPGFAFD